CGGNGLGMKGTGVEVGVVAGEVGEEKDERIGKVGEVLDMWEEEMKKGMRGGWVKDEVFVRLKKI
ncbi:hypothetical protein, partial [Cytobacillus oceanisediminis]|uniref:hypothetical protein n=1 Tax=Cytobacillus oceanisediminis TaxID=665099 RepID=UPI0016433B23